MPNYIALIMQMSITASKIEIVKTMDYLEFAKLMMRANKVLAESSGILRAASLLKKLCMVLIEVSWFPKISEAVGKY
jgi:UDP-N-acetylglucosamine 2-epimerase